MNALRSLGKQLASGTRTSRFAAVGQAELRCSDACQSLNEATESQARTLRSFSNEGLANQQTPSLAEFSQQVSRFSTSQSATALEPSGADGATVSAQPQPPGMNQPPRPGFAAQGPRDQRAPHPGGLQAGAGPKIGTVYVQSTKNNTICTLVDQGGMPVAWASAGSCGFKNARKSTPYAAQATAERIATKSMDKGWHTVRVVMRGLGFGKQSAVRALIKAGLNVTEIHERTPLPHNGCRPPKKRRV